MSVQTTYNDVPGAAVAGMQATMIAATLISRTVESAAVGFGRPVEQGTADKGCKLFDGGTVLGITLLDRSAEGITVVNGKVTARTADAFGVGESARVITKGDVWVVSTTGNVAGDPVYVRPSNGTFQNSSANSGVLIAGARWDTTATAGNLAVVRLG